MSEITLEYWPLSACSEKRCEDNHKGHDVGLLTNSIMRYGFRDPLEFDSTLDRFVAGHGRIEALEALYRQGKQDWYKHWPPQYLKEADDKTWLIPVITGAAADSPNSALAYLLDNNNLTMQGGNFNPEEIGRMYQDKLGYAGVLAKLHQANELPETVDQDDLQYFLSRLAKESEPKEDRNEPDRSGGLEYILQFETVNQKQKFLDFLDYLRHEYPEDDSHIGRLIQHIEMIL